MKQEPDSAVPVRTRAVPEANEALQVAALQSIPEGTLVTTPEPVPGYIGFALFGLETIAFVNLLEESRFLGKPRWGALFLALVFAVVSFFLIERYTVFSHAAPIERLSFLTEETRSALERKGVKTSYAIDPRLLDARERQSLALMHLKGLGVVHLEQLQRHGVDTVGDLAKLDERQLSAIIGEKNMRRVRVYLRAARAASAPSP